MNYDDNDPPYQCAQMANSGTKSIAALGTKSWTNTTNAAYNELTDCSYRSSSAVTVLSMSSFGSFTATATNWSSSGTRHFAAGVIWSTGHVDEGQFSSSNNCGDNDGHLKATILKIAGIKPDSMATSTTQGSTLKITGTASPSGISAGYVVLRVDGQVAMTTNPKTGEPVQVAGAVSSGKWTINWPVSQSVGTHNVDFIYGGDSSKCPKVASTCGYSQGKSSRYSVQIKSASPAASLAPATSSQMLSQPIEPISGDATVSASHQEIAKKLDVKVITKRGRMPAKLRAHCPAGHFPLFAEIFGPPGSDGLAWGRKAGVSVKRDAASRGTKVAVQLACRKNGPSYLIKEAGFGSRGADKLQAKGSRKLVLGGPGNDRLRVSRRHGVALGGLGDDRIYIHSDRGIAVGGPGNDVIHSSAAKPTLIVGGPGRDRLVGAGRARINAVDGQRDVVVCKGGEVHARVDARDRVVGSCNRV